VGRDEVPAESAGIAAPPELSVPSQVSPEKVSQVEEPLEPPAPFDLDDWLSNVTELGPEDGGPQNES
jgi:hypothetical protein